MKKTLYLVFLLSYKIGFLNSAPKADSIDYFFDHIYVIGKKEAPKYLFSNSKINKKSIANNSTSISINKTITKVPGIFTLSEFNFSQDTRISIRGNGLRSPFGIRGVKILSDNIPESTPDGQGQLDNIDLNYLKNIKIYRGSASPLFGNASGGAINFSSIIPTGENIERYKLVVDNRRSHIINYFINRSYKIFNWNFCLSRQQLIGHRDHSKMLSNIFNSMITLNTERLGNFSIHLNYLDNPYALDPGSLDKNQKNQNPFSAREENIEYDSRESVIQTKISISHDRRLRNNIFFKQKFWLTKRYFQNKLPFQKNGQVKLDRDYWGINSKYIYDFSTRNFNYSLLFGFEINNQEDERKRFNNILGTRGNLTYDAIESFSSFGTFSQLKILMENFIFLSGFRYDKSLVILDENQNKNSNFKEDYFSLSPVFGINYKPNQMLNIFGNFSTHFDTPTLSEISNNLIKDSTSLTNTTLVPQISKSFEFGIKFENQNLDIYEIVLFKSELNNGIIPYEIENEPGRSYYRNAGVTHKIGAEMSISKTLSNNLSINFINSLSNFKFISYEVGDSNFDGNLLPLVPKHFGFFDITWDQKDILSGLIEFHFTDGFFLDDNNTIKTNRAYLTDIQFAKKIIFQKIKFELTMRVNNCFDISYDSNLRLNAYGGRYYEPGPKRNYSISIKI